MSWVPLWLSFQIAMISMLVTVVIGTGLALLLTWRRLPAREFFDAVISSPLVLPPTVLGYYLLTVFGKDGAIGHAWESMTGSPIVFTFTGAVIAASAGSMPLVVRSVRLGLESIDPNLINAARTLGAGPVRVLFTVTLPLAAPGIIAGAMMGFARSLGDYGATQMVAGARLYGTPTASIYVMEQLYANNDDRVFAMAAATTAVGVTMLFCANLLTRRLHIHRG
jgi:molybdate transport system permease protein